jgi:hypothetical protein
VSKRDQVGCYCAAEVGNVTDLGTVLTAGGMKVAFPDRLGLGV